MFGLRIALVTLLTVAVLLVTAAPTGAQWYGWGSSCTSGQEYGFSGDSGYVCQQGSAWAGYGYGQSQSSMWLQGYNTWPVYQQQSYYAPGYQQTVYRSPLAFCSHVERAVGNCY